MTSPASTRLDKHAAAFSGVSIPAVHCPKRFIWKDIDFQGDISMETVRSFLKEEDSREARTLLNKLIEDKGVEDMLITLADCLKDHLRSGISEEAVREQLGTYSES